MSNRSKRMTDGSGEQGGVDPGCETGHSRFQKERMTLSRDAPPHEIRRLRGRAVGDFPPFLLLVVSGFKHPPSAFQIVVESM